MNINNITNFMVRTDTIENILRDISKTKVLTAQEEKDMFVKYEDAGTEEEKLAIRNEIITRNLRFVFAVAKRYDNNELLPDLVSVGLIGMAIAFDKYDWRSGNRFCSFAVWYIRREINAYLTKENLMIRPKNNSRVTPKVKRIENEFMLKNGRRPTSSEVIEILDKEYGIKVTDECDVYAARIDRIDSFIGDEEDNTFEKSPVFNEKTAVDNEFDTEVDDSATSYAMSEALKTLTDRERKIVSMAYGYGYPREYKDKEIGEILGLTSERVRQIKHASVKKLKSAYLAASEA